MSFLDYKRKYMMSDDLVILEAAPYDRFKFQQVSNDNSLECMLIRFLSEYGPDIPESDPEDVLIVSYTHTPSGNNLHHLEIEYQMDGMGYQVEAEFNYFPKPKPDYFTHVTVEDLAIYQVANNSLT